MKENVFLFSKRLWAHFSNISAGSRNFFVVLSLLLPSRCCSPYDALKGSHLQKHVLSKYSCLSRLEPFQNDVCCRAIFSQMQPQQSNTLLGLTSVKSRSLQSNAVSKLLVPITHNRSPIVFLEYSWCWPQFPGHDILLELYS